MKCGMCHKEIPEVLPDKENRCGACSGGCRKIHCPYCGYGNPVMPNYLKKFMSDDKVNGRD